MFLYFLSRSDGQRSKKAAAQSGFVSSCAAALPLWSRLPILYLRRTTSAYGPADLHPYNAKKITGFHPIIFSFSILKNVCEQDDKPGYVVGWPSI